MFTHLHTEVYPHQHTLVSEARDCEYELAMAALEGPDPDEAYERHLENAGIDETHAQDAYEAAMGCESFTDAWDRVSPGTRPGYVAA